MPMRGISRFSRETLLSHSTGKLRREPFCVSQRFWYRESLMDRRGVGRNEYHDFLSKNFCLTVPKNFVGEPFSVSQSFCYRKILWIRGWEEGRSITLICQFFLSHSTEKFRRGTFLFHKIFLVSKYSMDKRWGVKEGGVSRYSVKKFLSQSTEKLRREHFCVSLISDV